MSVSQEEIDLYTLLKDLPDFDCYPIPETWYKRFDIPPRDPTSLREFLASGYSMKCATEMKDLPMLRINKPQQNGKLAVVPDFEPIHVETVTKPFEIKQGDEFPHVLPSLLTEQSSAIEPQVESHD